MFATTPDSSDFEMHAPIPDAEVSCMLLEGESVDAPSDMELEDSSGSDVPAEIPFERGQWRPGKNCGKFASDFTAPLARVLIANLFCPGWMQGRFRTTAGKECCWLLSSGR